MSEHTPTLARTLIHIGNDNNGICAISLSPPRIPEKDMRDAMVARAKADADLIVEAVNNHEALKAENERLSERVKFLEQTESNELARLRSELEQARNYLKSISNQCGNVIYNCEQRPASNDRHLSSWRSVKEFADNSLELTSTERR